MISKTRRLSIVVGAILAASSIVRAAEPGAEDNLGEMSLEDLMNVEVTSVSRYSQKASEAPAAISVITDEDIRRSGHHSIPEVLRLSPGLSVSRIDANKWAISARGFSERFSNKLLVLMDGRSIYRAADAGVHWDTPDYILPDLERIEVIRGPGATLWGSNAVNGVINITSKSAKDTQGTLVDIVGGNKESLAGVRYGGRFNDDQTYYRVWGKFATTEDFLESAQDGWDTTSAGFRVDHYPTHNDAFTVIGDVQLENIQDHELHRLPGPPSIEREYYSSETFAGNLLARWTHTISDKSDFSLHFYYDRIDREQFGMGWEEDTLDIDFQHRFPLGDRHMIVWGLGFRYISDHFADAELIRFDPRGRDDHRVTAFVQDDITLVPDRLHLILGSKFEHTSYSGFEVQPSVRGVWTPSENTTVWGAVSRGVRTPDRVEQDLIGVNTFFPGEGGVPIEVDLQSNEDFETEKLWAYELGYRVRPSENLTVDIAAFYHRHTDLRTFNLGQGQFGPNPPRVIVPMTFSNGMDAKSYGVEVAVNMQVSQKWRVAGSYSFLHVDPDPHTSNADPSMATQLEDGEPRNQIQLHSYYDLTRTLEFNTSVYYTDDLGAYDVPSNLRLDLALNWKPKENLRVSVGVQNLLDNQHPEFSDLFSPRTEVPRMVFGQLTWEF